MLLEYNYCLENPDVLKKDIVEVQLLSELERIMYGEEIIGGFVNMSGDKYLRLVLTVQLYGSLVHLNYIYLYIVLCYRSPYPALFS